MTGMRKMIENLSSVTFTPASQERLDEIIAASKFIDSDQFNPLIWPHLSDDEDDEDEEDWW